MEEDRASEAANPPEPDELAEVAPLLAPDAFGRVFQVGEAEAVGDIQYQYTGAEAAASQRRVKQAATVRPRMAEHLVATVPQLTSPGRAQRVSERV